MDFDAHLNDSLKLLKADQCFRRPLVVESIEGSCVWIEGERKVNWASNDYLGLAQNPAVKEAAASAIERWGVGARAARLLSGTTALHGTLEQKLARFFGVEAALTFSSGYLANLGLLQSVVRSEDTVFLDRSAHASLVDGARASRAHLRVFAHNDMDQLKKLLRRPASGRRLIVTEGCFSMDGDRSPVRDILQLAHECDAMVYVDDAHGAFVEGESGRGVCESFLGDPALILMVTFGKALGVQGAAVLGSRTLIEFLTNKARTFLFETAPAVPVTAAAIKALEIAEGNPNLRMRVRELSERMHRSLKTLGVETSQEPSVILPVIVGSASRAVAQSRLLWEKGHWCPPIRPPTVKAGRSRLRLSVTAGHTNAQADALIQSLSEGMHGEA